MVSPITLPNRVRKFMHFHPLSCSGIEGFSIVEAVDGRTMLRLRFLDFLRFLLRTLLFLIHNLAELSLCNALSPLFAIGSQSNMAAAMMTSC